jgi:hypothetical protein
MPAMPPAGATSNSSPPISATRTRAGPTPARATATGAFEPTCAACILWIGPPSRAGADPTFLAQRNDRRHLVVEQRHALHLLGCGELAAALRPTWVVGDIGAARQGQPGIAFGTQPDADGRGRPSLGVWAIKHRLPSPEVSAGRVPAPCLGSCAVWGGRRAPQAPLR